jgi:hypothetical protein
MSALPFKADIDHEKSAWCQTQTIKRYSIMSSARPTISGGTMSPKVFAVLRLMTNSYLFGIARASRPALRL